MSETDPTETGEQDVLPEVRPSKRVIQLQALDTSHAPARMSAVPPIKGLTCTS